VNSAVASTESGSFLDYALAYAERGKLPVVPLRAGEKFPPLLENWPTLATTDAQQIRAWWTQWPSANIGVVARGLVIVDVDVRNDGDTSLAALEQAHGKLPETFTARTPTGGRHIYLRLPEGHPGAGNSAGKLGSGIDIKGQAGYVLGVGSRVAAGEYTFEGTTDIAQAPHWLLELLGTASAKKSTTPASDIPDAPDAVVERAREWLALQPEAVEGDGGDHRTYATACGLRDRGVSEAQAVELLAGEWNERCAPPWTLADLETKAANAFRYAENPPGCMPVVTAADFKAVPANDAPAQKPAHESGIRVHRVCDLAELNPGPELWEGVLPERAIFAIGALPGRSKSYVATGLCYALGTDAGEYLGRKLPKGTAAAYVDVERMGATKLRLAVWLHVDEKRAQGLHMTLLDGVRLNDPATVKALIEALQGLGGRPLSLVIIDSLGAALPGQEMNASGPATMAGAQLRRIRDSLGCAVGVVSHSPKSGDETVAGSLHFDAIFDSVLIVRSENGGSAGSLYLKKDNALALDEHERFTHWKAESVHATLGERQVRVHRLSAGGPPKVLPKGAKPGTVLAEAWSILCQSFPDNRPVTNSEFEEALRAADTIEVKKGTVRELKRAWKTARPSWITVHADKTFNRRME
jgi:hypothetical protein